MIIPDTAAATIIATLAAKLETMEEDLAFYKRRVDECCAQDAALDAAQRKIDSLESRFERSQADMEHFRSLAEKNQRAAEATTAVASLLNYAIGEFYPDDVSLVVRAKGRNNKIDCIKALRSYRRIMGGADGLKECKDDVEAYCARL